MGGKAVITDVEGMHLPIIHSTAKAKVHPKGSYIPEEEGLLSCFTAPITMLTHYLKVTYLGSYCMGLYHNKPINLKVWYTNTPGNATRKYSRYTPRTVVRILLM